MHFPDFNTQTLSVQAQALCRDGVYLSERQSADCLVILYALAAFYVEVWYRLHTSEVVMLTAFTETALLEPYLDRISLHGLLPPPLFQ